MSTSPSPSPPPSQVSKQPPPAPKRPSRRAWHGQPPSSQVCRELFPSDDNNDVLLEDVLEVISPDDN